jgi:hypothetical protein
MTDDMIALARRAVACRGWRWMPGMKLTAGLRLSESLVPFTFPVDLPDFTDPATLGCLLALVREAWDDHRLTLFYHYSYSDWRLYTPRGAFVQSPNEAEALVAALEAAP